MKQEFSEDYLAFYYWIKNGDNVPWNNDTAFDGDITLEYSDPTLDNSVPTPTQLDNTTIEALSAAKKVIILPRPGTVSMEIRFKSDGNENDANVVEVYAAAGDDHYRHIGQVTVTQGLQIYTTGIYFADTVALTETWLTATAEPSPADSIGSLVLNVHGYDRFLLVASDLVTTTLYADFRRH